MRPGKQIERGGGGGRKNGVGENNIEAHASLMYPSRHEPVGFKKKESEAQGCTGTFEQGRNCKEKKKFAWGVLFKGGKRKVQGRKE